MKRIVHAFRGQWNVEELFRRANAGGVVPSGASFQWADSCLQALHRIRLRVIANRSNVPTLSRLSHRVASRSRVASREIGRIHSTCPSTVALAYPAPYGVGMSSLGYQTIYRAIQESGRFACERAFSDTGTGTLESGRPVSEYPLLAVSIAYELEIVELIGLLERAGIPPLRESRGEQHPCVVAGGPITFSNPLPLAPFVDAIVFGEADTLVLEVLEATLSASRREQQWQALCAISSVVVPAVQGARTTSLTRSDGAVLPAWGPIRSPDMALRDMFLIELVRGCSRGCKYCVMRRTTNGGMRVIDADRVLSLVPPDARRVGLVGAGVSDHPELCRVVATLADRGVEVGLSSIRPERLSGDLVTALRRARYRTVTTAMDGMSERLRTGVERHTRADALIRAAECCRKAGIRRMKLYVMVGLPGERDEDVDECASLVTELSRILPVSLGVSPFCAKRNTPLEGAPFAGVGLIDARMQRLRSQLQGRAEVRATSARWAWVEHVLAQGGIEEGLAVLEAHRHGGSFGAFRSALG